MSIDTLLNHLSEEEKQPPAYYPLDLAIQYIAYNHKPINVNNARIIYKDAPEDLEKLKIAQKEIQIFLLNGKIKSRYHRTENALTDQGITIHQPIETNVDVWAGEMDWQSMCLNYADKECDLDLYFYDIEVCTEDLLKYFHPGTNTTLKKDLSPKEKNSLLKILYGIAVSKYSFEKDPRETTSKIHRDLELQGIDISRDTIKKWLDLSKENFEDLINR